MTHIEALKPCPFCGAKPEYDTTLDQHEGVTRHTIRCGAGTEGCPTHPITWGVLTKAEAIDLWNTRIDTALKSGEPSGEVMDRVIKQLDDEIEGLRRRYRSTSGYIDPERGERMKRLLNELKAAMNEDDAQPPEAWSKSRQEMLDGWSKSSPTSEPVKVDNQSAKGDFLLTDEQIKHMRDRFLGWKLPKDFRPDNGISYTPTQCSAATGEMPYGTNVFDAQQAEQMIRFMLEGLPQATPDQVKVSLIACSHQVARMQNDKMPRDIAEAVLDEAIKQGARIAYD